MSTISYFWTDGNNKGFQSFYQKTEEYYSKIVGGLENRKGFVPYNLSDKIEVVGAICMAKELYCSRKG